MGAAGQPLPPPFFRIFGWYDAQSFSYASEPCGRMGIAGGPISGVLQCIGIVEVIGFKRWEGFEARESEDFQAEVEATAQNEELLRLPAGRRKEGKRLPIEDVRKTLGVE